VISIDISRQEEGGLETFQVPFHIIEDMEHSSSPKYTTFTIKLNSLPDVGKGVAVRNQEVTWTLRIERRDAVPFLRALKARNVVCSTKHS